MKKLIKNYELINYVSVYEITEIRNNTIYKTKFKGYAHKDRPMQKNETYSSLPMKIIQLGEVVLNIID